MENLENEVNYFSFPAKPTIIMPKNNIYYYLATKTVIKGQTDSKVLFSMGGGT